MALGLRHISSSVARSVIVLSALVSAAAVMRHLLTVLVGTAGCFVALTFFVPLATGR